MPLIELKDIAYTYKVEKKERIPMALHSISLSIDQGDFIGLIGRTGSGKTTLLQLMNGIRKPTSGSVCYQGRELWKDKLLRKRIYSEIGMVFQYPENQLFEETVERDIAFGPKNMGLSQEEISARIREITDLLQISSRLLKRNPFELSGGEKRRVAIAGVLVMRPMVLLLDEPTVGLDPKGRRELLSLIRSYYRKYEATILISSHHMDDIASMCNKVLVLEKGEMVSFGSTSRIFSDSALLQQLGLSLPSYAEIFHRLKQHGIPVRTDVFTLEDAKRECLRLLTQQENANA